MLTPLQLIRAVRFKMDEFIAKYGEPPGRMVFSAKLINEIGYDNCQRAFGCPVVRGNGFIPGYVFRIRAGDNVLDTEITEQ